MRARGQIDIVTLLAWSVFLLGTGWLAFGVWVLLTGTRP